MALTISLQQGDGFWVCGDKPSDDIHFVLDEVFLSRGFILIDDEGQKFECRTDDEVEIFPNVWVSDGLRLIVGKARAVFNAPKTILILRDELYELKRPKPVGGIHWIGWKPKRKAA